MRRSVKVSLALLPFALVLGWAAAGVALAGGGCHQGVGAAPTEGMATVVKIDGCTFAPTVTRVAVGTEVRFLNSSPQLHDVTGRNGEWGSDTLRDGESFAHRFAVPGLYPYSCSLHPGMAGVVAVGSPAVNLVADVQQPAVQPDVASAPVAASAEPSMVPVVAAAGFGVLAGALVGGVIASRARRMDPAQ